MVLVDGEVTHVVRKRPAGGRVPHPGELRGRRTSGSTSTADGADPAALGRWVLEAVGHDLLYARVDLLLDENDAWQVAELELTEPDLYLGCRARGRRRKLAAAALSPRVTAPELRPSVPRDVGEPRAGDRATRPRPT